MNNDKREKVIKFIQDNLINYMYFATSLFTVDEIHEFERLSKNEDLSKSERCEVSLGVKYYRPEFDKYINRISKMNTHIIGTINYWTKMCINHRASVLTAFNSVMKYLKSENYKDVIVDIDYDVVNYLYEKNKELIFNNKKQ